MGWTPGAVADYLANPERGCTPEAGESGDLIVTAQDGLGRPRPLGEVLEELKAEGPAHLRCAAAQSPVALGAASPGLDASDKTSIEWFQEGIAAGELGPKVPR